MPTTRIEDVVTPDTFSGYVRQRTEEKWNLLQAGVVARDPFLDNLLEGNASQQGGGVIFQIPSWQPLDSTDADNVSTDATADILRLVGGGVAGEIFDALTSGQSLGSGLTGAVLAATARGDSVPAKILSSLETAVRLSRNKSWTANDLASRLAGDNAMDAIVDLQSDYWRIRLQKVMIASAQGVFNDNDAAPAGTEHVQGDLTNDVSGGAFVDGTTNIQAENVIDTLALMGDSSDDVVAMMVHSTVMATLRKNNLIDFVPDSINGLAVRIPTFQGRRLIQDDSMPNPAGDATIGAQTAAGIYHTWLLGSDAFRYGTADPAVPTAIHREELAGNGAGQEVLTNRVEWMVHPSGHAFQIASPPPGGPANANAAGGLSHVDSWQRVFPERKQIKIVRLITRES